ncbi:hypothetical protein H2199_007158 [Coniosporium tulheliwenetii]|uniref:Uncharacterized protein n=1 Tax=Coniosporium tulheliwenetii TaxID=3383036 RepID=A0ACC2YRP0_9PEZI|nr:hypothetical protein H2199_007158 [Cladosporium sp. JES 115]
MALAAVLTAMNLSDKSSLHPFFDKTRRSKSSTAQEQHTTSPTLNRTIADGGSDAGSNEPKQKKRAGRKKAKAEASVGTAKQASILSLTQGRIAEGHNGKNEATSLEEDPNLDRRKRRRTTSAIDDVVPAPEGVQPGAPSSLSWHEQLLAEEGIGDTQVEVLDTIVAERSANDSILIPRTPPPNESSISLPVPVQAELPPSPLPLPQDGLNTLEVAGRRIHLERPSASPRKTTPKKMLKLNAAGRFSSLVLNQRPAPSDVAIKVSPVKRKRSKRVKDHKFVVIRYGHTDQGRATIGGRIQEILDSNKMDANTPIKPKSQLAHRSLPIHPKASGEDSRKHHDIFSRPMKTASTPGKIRALALAAHPSSDIPAFAAFGMERAKLLKYPGSREAPWPWEGTAHVREPSDVKLASDLVRESSISISGSSLPGPRKMKDNAIQISEQEGLVSLYSSALDINSWKDTPHDQDLIPEMLRVPKRLLVTGVDMQSAVLKELRSCSTLYNHYDSDVLTVDDHLAKVNLALRRLYNGINSTLTAWEKGQCETRTWTQKYAPKLAEDVLQSGSEATILRDWLRGLTVSAVEGGSKDAPKGSGPSSRTMAAKGVTSKPVKKRKKRKAEDLDDFIVDSDGEMAEMDELTGPEELLTGESGRAQKRSVVRTGDLESRNGRPSKMTNAMLLSGPHGCGKTAAVYAVAKELGFEIFEINSGSRRSGKDVLDKIGDMVENHLVQRGSGGSTAGDVADDTSRFSDALKKDLQSGRQGTMNTFFKPAIQKKASPKSEHRTAKPSKNTLKEAAKQTQPRQQKQSLILLEEVDILFEEDKQFWMTVFNLLNHSKRPIIMTCNDENLIPLDALSLHAILRLSPPPSDLATDYLLLLAANEGHLLKRDAVSSLYDSKHHDLRASITELDFWCQMAVGDQKGGLEWMFQRWPPGSDIDDHGRTIRVASKGTYQAGMGWLGRDLIAATEHVGFDKNFEVLHEIWENWHLSADWDIDGLQSTTGSAVLEDGASLAKDTKALSDLENLLDAASAADVYCRIGLPTGRQESIDTTQSPLTDKARSNFIEGYPILQADPVTDYSATDTKLALSTHLSIERQLTTSNHTEPEPTCQPLTEQTLISRILAYKTHTLIHAPLTRAAFSVFDPISEPVVSGPSHSSAALTTSSFDRPFAILTTDLAPYVRSIAAHDLRLEEHRLRLGNLLSEGGGARNGKRVRTTRAARSALEGGKRENTRRERWFGKELNLALVMRTAGRGWAGAGGGVRKGDQIVGSVAGSVSGSVDEGTAVGGQYELE